MSSWFDTLVQRRRSHTPWAIVSVTAFMKEMAYHTPEQIEGHAPHRFTNALSLDPTRCFRCDAAIDRPWHVEDTAVALRVKYRHDVATRLWWRLDWWSEDSQ